MKRITRLVSRGLFSAGLAGALAFGAMQVTAAPARAAARECDIIICDQRCRDLGFSYGYCDPSPLKGNCACGNW